MLWRIACWPSARHTTQLGLIKSDSTAATATTSATKRVLSPMEPLLMVDRCGRGLVLLWRAERTSSSAMEDLVSTLLCPRDPFRESVLHIVKAVITQWPVGSLGRFHEWHLPRSSRQANYTRFFRPNVQNEDGCCQFNGEWLWRTQGLYLTIQHVCQLRWIPRLKTIRQKLSYYFHGFQSMKWSLWRVCLKARSISLSYTFADHAATSGHIGSGTVKSAVQ